MYKFILVIFFLIQLGCGNQLFLKNVFHPKHSIKEIEGVFICEFLYDKAGNEYTFIKQHIINREEKYPLQPIDELRFISFYCDSDDIKYLYDYFYHIDKKDIFDIAQYQDKNAHKMKHGYYHGGDIYYMNEKKDIAIAFYLKGKGALFKSICKEYLKSESYDDIDCFPVPKNLKTPFISLLQIDTAYSLSENQQKLHNLTKSNLERFALSICE